MVKLYCGKINRDDADLKIETKDHECLDNLPRKSIGQQVEAFLLAGENLEMSRRAMFELENYDPDRDIEEYDTGLDEYSDFHDYYEAQKEVSEKYRKARESMMKAKANKADVRAQKKAEEGSNVVSSESNVDKNQEKN